MKTYSHIRRKALDEAAKSLEPTFTLEFSKHEERPRVKGRYAPYAPADSAPRLGARGMPLPMAWVVERTLAAPSVPPTRRAAASQWRAWERQRLERVVGMISSSNFTARSNDLMATARSPVCP